MRKYRGLTKDGNLVYGWYYHNHFVDEHKIFVCISPSTFDIFDVIPETVGQFTGLKDKNLWENDVLESLDGLRRYIISYHEKQGKWYLKGIGDAFDENSPVWSEYNHIGNIHQNPELLEKQGE